MSRRQNNEQKDREKEQEMQNPSGIVHRLCYPVLKSKKITPVTETTGGGMGENKVKEMKN